MQRTGRLWFKMRRTEAGQEGMMGEAGAWPEPMAKRARADSSMYSGMESTFWRHWWWNGGYFGAIFAVKNVLPKAEVRLPS